MTIAYLSNSFPETTESYVTAEIRELRKHGYAVLPCSVRKTKYSQETDALASETLNVLPLHIGPCLRAGWLYFRHAFAIHDLVWRALRGPETLSRRMRALAHTYVGIYLAALLSSKNIRHIHVHHGYFAAWVGMVAARILHAGFSMTLHGSDLLVRADYLDVKLDNCKFCSTVSDFNRQYLLDRYPSVDPRKLLVHRLGVDTTVWRNDRRESRDGNAPFYILSVGRLHPVKNHAFLVLACRALKAAAVNFRCAIAGEGSERKPLEQLIELLGLQQEVTLLGEVQRHDLPLLYAQADVVVLTSRSEGLPVTLMEAMAMERIVLAPGITGIPEIVHHGKTGFLYQPDSMEDFLTKLQIVIHARELLTEIQRNARKHVEQHFNASLTLPQFVTSFLSQIDASQPPGPEALREKAHENPVLQQI